MKPIMLNSNGSLMRKCEEYGQPLLCGPQYQGYHFYVDETSATNGDGTELNPWNSINNAFNAEIYKRCQQPCTKVYVHISGSIQYGIGYSAGGSLYPVQNYRLNLIFMPWKQERVAVNPGLNYLSPQQPSEQVATYCKGVEYRNFDFTQQAHPAGSGISMVCIYGYSNLIDCTINMYIDGNAAAGTYYSTIGATPLANANIVINSTINVYAYYENSDTNRGRWLVIGGCSINSTIDTTYSYTITGNYRNVEGRCMYCYGKMIGVTIEVNIDIDNSIYNDGGVTFNLVDCCGTPQTSIKNSNFSTTAKNYGRCYLGGIYGVVQMHSSNIYISAINTRSVSVTCRVLGFDGSGELVDCSITATVSANSITETGGFFKALGINKLDSNSLLIDSCIISASATVAKWPPTGSIYNHGLYQLQCALFAQFDALNTVYIIDSDLSSGSCLYQQYVGSSGTITDVPNGCSSEDYYPASCMLGNSP